MMKKPTEVGVYAVYDLKGKLFDIPFFAASNLFAERKFIMDMRTEKTMLKAFPGDFDLYLIGTYDKEDRKSVV